MNTSRAAVLWRVILRLAVATMALGPAIAAPAPDLDKAIEPYTKPQQRVHVDESRTINLVCLGQGSPTVILSSGLGGWSFWWWPVQLEVAKQTRVCAWDRAGYGFSSPSSEPQDMVHTTADLEHALQRAHIRPPYVMVGHSLGGLESLRFADLHPKSVVGMVLVDPDIPDRAALEQRVAPQFAVMRQAYGKQFVKQLEDCAAHLRDGTLKPDAVDFQPCTEASHLPDFLGRVKTVIARLDADPARLLTHASLNREQYSDADARQLANPRRHYGDMPLIVLSAGRDESSAIPRDAPGVDTPEKLANLREQAARFVHEGWLPAHEAYAALSTQGQHRMVPDVGHNIPTEKPGVVVGAIVELLRDRKH